MSRPPPRILQSRENAHLRQIFLVSNIKATTEQPWPSGNASDSDQHSPGFKVHRRSLVRSGRALNPALNSRARTKLILEAPSKLQGIGGNGVKIE